MERQQTGAIGWQLLGKMMVAPDAAQIYRH